MLTYTYGEYSSVQTVGGQDILQPSKDSHAISAQHFASFPGPRMRLPNHQPLPVLSHLLE